MLANTEQPFTLSVAEGDIALLHKKLDLARFPGGLEEADWDYGAALADVKRLAEHWRWTFDWRKAEGEINKLPMFTRDITVDGFGSLNIHYIHQKSEVGMPFRSSSSTAVRPGHFLEVRKMLPLLTARSPGHPSFHVVALSLPGFGFSEAPKMPGFAGRQYAEVFNKLMCSLGYDEYVYQGGDWGHVLGLHAVTHDRGKHIKAWHTNTPAARPPALLSHPLLFLDMLTIPFKTTVQADVEHNKKLLKTGFGYLSIQSTKPHTLGFSLADSPVGLLAWIYEKLVSWSDKYPWTDDEVIEWVSIYWFSRAGPDSAERIYYEMTCGGTHDVFEGTKWTSVPLGVSYFPHGIVRLPRSWSHTLGHLVFESGHGCGGHFAAFERPDELASDLRVMFGDGGPAHGVVSGKRGYD